MRRYLDDGDSARAAYRDGHIPMTIAALPEPLLYPGSWSDWCSSGKPIAVGPEPGTL